MGNYKQKVKIEKFLDHYISVVVVTLITIYALFADDFRLLAIKPEHDNMFYVCGLLGMFAFTIEIVLASYAKEGYWNSFFFWLDIISTVSMITDIGWIWIWLF